MPDTDSPGIPEWDALGIPVDDEAEPLDANADDDSEAPS